MMFPVIKLLELKVLPQPESAVQGNALRLCMVLLTGIIVLGIPNFSTLMALVGATCCTLLAFTLPGVFHLQITRRMHGSISSSALCMDVFLIALGVVGSVHWSLINPSASLLFNRAIIGTLDALFRLQVDAKKPPDFKSLHDHFNSSSLNALMLFNSSEPS
jgi:proton-coupled amino acid transporter